MEDEGSRSDVETSADDSTAGETGLLDVESNPGETGESNPDANTQFMQELHASMTQVHEEAVKEHKERVKDIEHEKESSIRQSKYSFARHVQAKLEKISLRSNIVRFKYDSYKRWHDCVNIGIILASTALTVIETVKAELQLTKTPDKGTNSVFTLIPVFLATMTAVAASMLKFKRFQEKMEEMQKCIEKAIMVMFQLKRVLEDIRHVNSMEELDKIRENYSKNTFDLYSKTQEEMERCLKYSDLVEHMETYHALTLEYQQAEYEFEIKTARLAECKKIRLNDGEEKKSKDAELPEDTACDKRPKKKRRRCC